MTISAPECTCEPFVFAEGMPWQTKIHGRECPAFCMCALLGRVGRKGRIIHVETCGWYEPPKPFVSSGKVRGSLPYLMIVDENLD